MTRMLASVANLEEALLVLEAGADLIDLKAPATGALGALPAQRVAEIVAVVASRRPLSATVGDLPMEPATVLDAAREMAATGVDYVKLGFFPGGDWYGCIDALDGLAGGGIRLVAVLFGDQPPAPALLPKLAAAGFAGAMLDTLDKSAGPLTRHRELPQLREFVRSCRSLGLLAGLAGSLGEQDVLPLAALEPDYLGFRGALCRGRERQSGLDPERLGRIRMLLQGNPQRSATLPGTSPRRQGIAG